MTTRREHIEHLKWLIQRLEAHDLSDVRDSDKVRHFANIAALRREVEELENE